MAKTIHLLLGKIYRDNVKVRQVESHSKSFVVLLLRICSQADLLTERDARPLNLFEADGVLK